MRFIGNLIWLVFGGLVAGLIYAAIGTLLYISIIGIPFGKQCFKLGNIMMTPFRYEVYTDFEKHPIANVVWAIICGLMLAAGQFFVGCLFCLTVVGIPFGMQSFKIARLSLTPFGAKLVRI